MKIKMLYFSNFLFLLGKALYRPKIEPDGGKKVFVDLSGLPIKRPAYLVVSLLKFSGWTVYFRADAKNLLKMGEYGRRLFKGKSVVWTPFGSSGYRLLVTNRIMPAETSIKCINLNFDVFNAPEPDTNSLFFPISFHPDFLGREEREKSEQTVGENKDILVFFAGAMDRENSDKSETR